MFIFVILFVFARNTLLGCLSGLSDDSIECVGDEII
jgi:hypothetical protein